jgi:hypothetical protein
MAEGERYGFEQTLVSICFVEYLSFSIEGHRNLDILLCLSLYSFPYFKFST